MKSFHVQKVIEYFCPGHEPLLGSITLAKKYLGIPTKHGLNILEQYQAVALVIYFMNRASGVDGGIVADWMTLLKKEASIEYPKNTLYFSAIGDVYIVYDALKTNPTLISDKPGAVGLTYPLGTIINELQYQKEQYEGRQKDQRKKNRKIRFKLDRLLEKNRNLQRRLNAIIS